MKHIKICADSFPPYQYIDTDGVIKGKDYEIIKKVFLNEGYEVEIKIAAWNEVLEDFERRKYDALFQVQNTEERERKYFLSKKLRDAVTDVVKLSDRVINVNSYVDLENYRIGLIKGFANGDDIDNLQESCKVYYENTQSLIDALINRNIDLAVCDRGVRRYLTDVDERISEIDTLTYRRPLFVMFHNKAIRDEFNDSFIKVFQNSEK